MARRQDTHNSEGTTSLNLSVSTAKHAQWRSTLADGHEVTVRVYGEPMRGQPIPAATEFTILKRGFRTSGPAIPKVLKNEETGALPIGRGQRWTHRKPFSCSFVDDQNNSTSLSAEDALLVDALNDLTSEIMADELTAFAEQYRRLLREGMATSEDRVVRDTLNRVRLQERLLDSVHLVNQKEACELLGMSKKNPSATMSRKEENGELLRFTRDGRAVYPLLQFDPDARRLYPEIKEMIAMAEDWRSNYQILSWLVRPHLDFDGTPAEALKTYGDAVIAAFARETAEQSHG